MTTDISAPSAKLHAKLAEKGPEFVIANDIPRIWATGAQSFVNGPITMMVFREQNFLQDADGTPTDVVLKNVASLVMPTEVATEFHRLLGEALGVANGEG